jgi:hypothetical protein
MHCLDAAQDTRDTRGGVAVCMQGAQRVQHPATLYESYCTSTFVPVSSTAYLLDYDIAILFLLDFFAIRLSASERSRENNTD